MRSTAELTRASLPELARHLEGMVAREDVRVSEVCDLLLKKAVLSRLSGSPNEAPGAHGAIRSPG